MTHSSLMSTRTVRWMAGAVVVAGGLMATVSGMNAWAALPAATAASAAAPAASAPQGAPHGMRHGGKHHHGHHRHQDMKGAQKMGGPMMMMGGAFFPMGGRGMERMLDDIKATDAQRTQIKQIADAARTDMAKLHADHRQLHPQVMSLLTQPKIDAAAAEKLRQQINHLDDELMQIIGQRMKAAEKIGQYKKENNITILQTNRWNEILDRAFTKGEKLGLSKEFITRYFDAMHMESINHQNRIMNS